MLGHGSLAEDFACEYEFCPNLSGIFFCFFKHKDSAIYTWVEVFAVAKFGVSDDSQIVSSCVDPFEWYVEGFGCFGCAASAFSGRDEWSDEVDGFDFYVALEN